MIKVWDDVAWEDYVYWQTQDKKTLKKINMLLKDIDRNGYTGIGKPEPLVGDWAGYWSRRIDEKNRLIYKIVDGSIRIAQCKTHYGNKQSYSQFYTTGIIYKLNLLCYHDDILKRKAGTTKFRKGKDMTTMNRFGKLYSECRLDALLDERELGLCVMHSSIDKQKRGNCVLEVVLQ